MNDIRETIEYDYSELLDEYISGSIDRDHFFEKLYDEMFINDAVTSNGSGSYTFDRHLAEEHMMHNLDLLSDACSELGLVVDVIKDGPEACDVTIRCYLLGECLDAVIDEYEQE